MSRPTEKAAGIFCGSISDSGTMIFRVLIIISYLILAGPVFTFAQTTTRLAGHVYDRSDGYTVTAAMVAIINTEYRALTDESGYFHFENIPPGDYALEISADGYQSAKISDLTVLADVSTPVTVRLERKIYWLPDRTVVAASELPHKSECQVIDYEAVHRLHAGTIAEVLENIEGVHIQKAGANGTETRVSIRGCDPEQVLVLLDGHRLNPASGGMADLAEIPLEIVEKIEIYRGGQSGRFGPDALGGVVNIISQTPAAHDHSELRSSKSWAKWKTNRYEVTIRDYVPFSGIVTKLAYSSDGSISDFKYDYQIMPRPEIAKNYSGTRRNAYSGQRNYFWSALRSYKGILSISTTGQVFTSRNGLPGSVSEPDTTAYKTDDRVLVSARILYSGRTYPRLELAVGYSRLTQYYNNLEHPLEPYRYETRYTDDNFESRLNASGTFWSGNEFQTGIDYQRSILYHDDYYHPGSSMGRTVRDNVGIYLHDNQTVNLEARTLIEVATFDFSARWDNTTTRKDSTSWQDMTGSSEIDRLSCRAGFTLTHSGRLNVIVRGSYGTSYRLPAMNSLFWKGDTRSRGNPGLRPETSEHSDIGLEIGLSWWADLSGGITYFHSHIRDLIEWQPGYNGVWQPVNLAAARITGHEDFIHLIFFDGRLRLDYQNTLTVAKNRTAGINSYDKFLTYRPRYVTLITVSTSIWKLWSRYSARFVDIRYNKEANTKWYDAYRVDDAAVGIELEIGKAGLEGSYEIKNLWDESYVLIGHYPMPGRQWGIELTASLKFR